MEKKLSLNVRKITFRKWSRKGYSLFRMLNKIVRIGVLAITYHNATAALQIEATGIINDTTNIRVNIELEEIEVGTSRIPIVFQDVARIVQVVKYNELSNRPVNSLPDILRHFHTIDIRQRGPEGIQADLSLRGGTFDQTAILLNGINITDPQTGHHNLNIPISFSNIERIEILEGPGGRVYGPSAFNGAINIITKTGQKNSFNAAYTRGNYNFSDFDLSGSIVTGKFIHNISANHKKSDGYINNTDFDVQSIFLQSVGDLKTGNIDFQMGYSNKQFGANAFYTPRFPDQYEQTRTHFTSLKYKDKSALNLTTAIYWRRHHDRFELFRYDRPAWYIGHNYHLSDVFGISLNSWVISKFGKTSFGAELRSENIWSNVLGDKLISNIKVPGENAFFNRFKTRPGFSVFAEHNIKMNNFFLSAGILAQRNTDLALKWNFYPGIDLSYSLIPELKWFASAGKSLRLPTFTDLYYSGPTNLGNPELKPEETVQFETGIKYFVTGFYSHFSLYSQKGNDLIDWVKLPGDEIWRTTNHTTLHSRGFQLFMKLDFNNLIRNNFPVSSFGAGYNYLHLKKDRTQYISYYVLDNLKHKFTVNLEHPIINNIYSSWCIIYQQRNGSYSAYIGNQVTEKEYEPFWLVDWKVTYNFKSFELFVSANNLLNVTYVDFGNIEQPGRWLKTGVKLSIQ